MRRVAIVVAALGSALVAGFVAWRRNPRLGTRFVNERVNPMLVSRGLSGAGRSEIGTLEHVGRRSGIRRLSPVHPERTEDGFRIMVPLGADSQWMQNVLSAGHCRLQLRDTVYELDEPALLSPAEVTDLPAALRSILARLGFVYLRLHTFAEHEGALEDVTDEATAAPASEAVTAAVETSDEGTLQPETAPAVG